MGSSIDSSRLIVYRGSRRQRRIYGPNVWEAFDYVFAEPGGRFRRDIEELLPALAPHGHGNLQDIIGLSLSHCRSMNFLGIKLQVLVWLFRNILDHQQLYSPSLIDALYAPHFRRLEQELLARSSVHVPAFVSAGRVAQGSLEVDTAAGVAEPVLLSVLEEYVPANQVKDAAAVDT